MWHYRWRPDWGDFPEADGSRGHWKVGGKTSSNLFSAIVSVINSNDDERTSLDMIKKKKQWLVLHQNKW